MALITIQYNLQITEFGLEVIEVSVGNDVNYQIPGTSPRTT
jgi:hypothetical protein